MGKQKETLYTDCPLRDSEDGPGDHNDCIECNGLEFVSAGINTTQVTVLINEQQRVKHMDRFFEEHKEAFDTFIIWLRKNPYPPQV